MLKNTSKETAKKSFWQRLSFFTRFMLVLLMLGVTTFLVSVFAKQVFLKQELKGEVHIALAAPMTGTERSFGMMMRKGAQLYVDQINLSGGLDGHMLVLDVHDETGPSGTSVKIARKIAQDDKVLAVIGHGSPRNTALVSKIYAEHKIPTISIFPSGERNGNEYLFSTSFSADREARFLANYIRNVLIKRNASIVFETSFNNSGTVSHIKKVFKRFGVPIRHEWSFETTLEKPDERFAKIADEMKANPDTGAVFVLADPRNAARLLRQMKKKGLHNVVAGTSRLATLGMKSAIRPRERDDLLDKIYTTTPLLFDTASEQVQKFAADFVDKNQHQPDWAGAYAHDAIALLATSYIAMKVVETPPISQLREELRDKLKARNSLKTAFDGLSGPLFFSPKGHSETPVRIGLYNGSNLISAPVQLQPIRGKMSNYLQSLEEGRVLYVNNRFMYKTNVVYSGLEIIEIRKPDYAAKTFDMDFMIWFRFTGKFNPEDVVFKNAIKPIKLGKPDREDVQRGVKYRRFRARGTFSMDFLDKNRPYGSRVIGTAFKHRTLDSNNVLYVVDLLGIDLAKNGGYKEILQRDRVFGPSTSWDIDRAWMSQNLVERGTQGDPSYVGYGHNAPRFSSLAAAMVSKPSQFSIQSFLPGDMLIYAAIFGFLGILFANIMDTAKDDKGSVWSFYSLLLRVISWPLFLLSAGPLLLDFSSSHLQDNITDKLALGLKALWWLIGARIIMLVVDRFIWTPLENRTGRKIPGSIRSFSSLIILLFALFGILAFVFNQQLTSLLATSGLLTMIIGLAIQANIANIFSGVLLNMERPFHVGDILKIKAASGPKWTEVIDISWRSTKVKDNMGHIYNIPNAVMSESIIERMYAHDGTPYRQFLKFNIPSEYQPELVMQTMLMALRSTDLVVDSPAPGVDQKGMETDFGSSYLIYRCSYYVPTYKDRGKARNQVSERVWQTLLEAGISMKPLPSNAATQIATNALT